MTTSPADLLSAITVVADPRMKVDLSPPARALVSALDAGVGQAFGLGKSLTEAGVSLVGDVASKVVGEVSAELGAAIADIIGNVAEMIPFVGPVIKAITSIISFALSFGEDPSETCVRHLRTFPPLQTGSAIAGGPTVPADYFAPAYGVERMEDDPREWEELRQRMRDDPAIGGRFLPAGPVICPPALGMAWMQLTEGCIADLRWFNWHEARKALLTLADDKERRHLDSAKALRRRWAKAIRRDLRIASLQWKHQHPDDPRTRGLPLRWVDWFQKVRRGIVASWGPTLRALQIQGKQKRGGALDGGAALWMAYLDRLVLAFDRGHLTWEYAEWLFARQNRFAEKQYPFTSLDNHAWHKTIEPLLALKPTREYLDADNLCAAPPTWFWGKDPCPRMVVGSLRTVVENWRNSIDPYYASGASKISALEQEARRIGRDIGQQRASRIRSAMKGPLIVTAAPPPPDTDDDGEITGFVATAGALGALALLARALRGPR